MLGVFFKEEYILVYCAHWMIHIYGLIHEYWYKSRLQTIYCILICLVYHLHICLASRILPLSIHPSIDQKLYDMYIYLYNCNMYSSACLVLWWHHCVSNVFPLILCPFYGLLKYKHGFAWVYCPSSTLSSWSMYVCTIMWL